MQSNSRPAVSRELAPQVCLVRAANPGPMTFTGTNSWIINEPGDHAAIIVDPGPDDLAHRSAITAAIAARGARPAAILLTHGHPDHAAGASILAQQHNIAIFAADPDKADVAVRAETLRFGQTTVDVIPTPGHSGDSVTFLAASANSIFTGDTLMSVGPPAIFDPDGRVDDMLNSLERLHSIAADPDIAALPGHGMPLYAPRPLIELALAARHRRIAQVADAIDSGHGTIDELVDFMYGSVDPRVRRAVVKTVRAHVRYLCEQQGLDAAILTT